MVQYGDMQNLAHQNEIKGEIQQNEKIRHGGFFH